MNQTRPDLGCQDGAIGQVERVEGQPIIPAANQGISPERHRRGAKESEHFTGKWSSPPPPVGSIHLHIQAPSSPSTSHVFESESMLCFRKSLGPRFGGLLPGDVAHPEPGAIVPTLFRSPSVHFKPPTKNIRSHFFPPSHPTHTILPSNSPQHTTTHPSSTPPLLPTSWAPLQGPQLLHRHQLRVAPRARRRRQHGRRHAVASGADAEVGGACNPKPQTGALTGAPQTIKNLVSPSKKHVFCHGSEGPWYSIGIRFRTFSGAVM